MSFVIKRCQPLRGHSIKDYPESGTDCEIEDIMVEFEDGRMFGLRLFEWPNKTKRMSVVMYDHGLVKMEFRVKAP